jgi:hypothetical protein
MTVIVCKPTDEIVGTFEIEGLEDLRPNFVTFAARHAVSAYDLVKCGDQTWTVLLKNGHFSLMSGMVPRTSPPALPTLPQATVTGGVLKRAAGSYEQAGKTFALGDLIKMISVVLGVIAFLFGFFSIARFGGFGGLLLGLVIGAFSGVLAALPLYALGALLCVQSKILQASLDTSINTSPFLTNEERIAALKIEK